jgi:drug/metabolite transporter (DMT)-like permease
MASSAGIVTPDNTRLTAIGLMCAAVASFSLLDSAAKYIVTIAAMPILQAMWVRFLGHIAFSFVIFGPRRFIASTKSNRPGLQMLRGLLLMSTTGLNFLALQHLQLDQVATIFFLSPFVVAVLAGPILGEWIGWRRLVAILIGFSGVILVMRPGFGGIHWAVSYSFAATLFYAIYNILTRYLARHDSSMVTQVYSPLAGLIILTPLGIWAWQWPPDLWIWLIMISTGISGGFGHYLLILAHRRAPAPILAPFTYVGLVSQTLVGYLVFRDLPSVWTLAGGGVIVGSGLYLLYRERATSRLEGPAATSLSTDIRN